MHVSLTIPATTRLWFTSLQTMVGEFNDLLNPFLLYLYGVEVVFFFFIFIILQAVGFLGRVISSSQGLYLNTGHHKHRINTYTYQTSMPCVGFELTIPASERAKTVHASYRSATVTGEFNDNLS
jgi:Na+-transporting methylmalonyl-CoA/oxaloacetate decarboxylase gamma subunit